MDSASPSKDDRLPSQTRNSPDSQSGLLLNLILNVACHSHHSASEDVVKRIRRKSTGDAEGALACDTVLKCKNWGTSRLSPVSPVFPSGRRESGNLSHSTIKELLHVRLDAFAVDSSSNNDIQIPPVYK
jgi:hypothetical protein